MSGKSEARCRTLTEAFNRLGVPTKGRNIRQMWSGRSTDGRLVAVTLWSDFFADVDRRVYDTLSRGTTSAGRKPQTKRRLADLKYAQDKCVGIFTSIIITTAEATHSKIVSREIGPRMRVVGIDQITGEFRAERVGS